jgi:hypothetical protein
MNKRSSFHFVAWRKKPNKARKGGCTTDIAVPLLATMWGVPIYPSLRRRCGLYVACVPPDLT